MYILNNGTQYSCSDYRASPGIRAAFYGVEGIALPIVGEVTLYTDDGFEMAVQDTGNYTRLVYENSVLTLTNEPEPPTEPEEPPPTGPTPEERIATLEQELAVAKGKTDLTFNAFVDFCFNLPTILGGGA